MNDRQGEQRSEADAELEREIRRERKFTLAEAIGRLAGPGAMKGASPISRLQQAEAAIASWLSGRIPAGSLETVLHRSVEDSELLLNNPDQPLVVLAAHCEKVLHSDFLLKELVRNADVEWGRLMGEWPYFETENSPSHPDDPYTVESVRTTLQDLLTELAAEN